MVFAWIAMLNGDPPQNRGGYGDRMRFAMESDGNRIGAACRLPHRPLTRAAIICLKR
jgi:hypothetical protein